MKKCLAMLFVIFLIVIVSDYNNKMDEQYTFASDSAKREYLQSVIEDTTNSPEAVSKAIDELFLLPDKVWTQFYRNGGDIIITYDLPSDDAVGSFGIPYIGCYRIFVSPDYIEYALLHEFGHYLGYAKGVLRDSDYKNCLSERDKAIDGVLDSNTYFETDSEYFAELTKLYLHNKLDKSEYPLFTAYIEKLLSDF